MACSAAGRTAAAASPQLPEAPYHWRIWVISRLWLAMIRGSGQCQEAGGTKQGYPIDGCCL
jgi:hypothetical protein